MRIVGKSASGETGPSNNSRATSLPSGKRTHHFSKPGLAGFSKRGMLVARVVGVPPGQHHLDTNGYEP